MLNKAAALLLVSGAIAIWSGCGTTSSRYLYATIPASNDIVIYREDPNSGVLTQLASSPVTAGSGVQSAAIHSSGKFLYAANSGEGDVSRFSISSGALTELTPRTPVGIGPNLLAIDSSGGFLYVGNAGSLSISVFSIDSSNNGVLTPVGNAFPIGMTPINMKLSPSGSVLYVTGAGSPGIIEAFSLNKGVPTVVAGSPFQTGRNPYGLVIDPSGTHLYTGNELDNSISEFQINSDGSITQLSDSPIGESYVGPIALLINQSGQYLYVANVGSTNLAAYSIGSSGALTLLSTSPFATGSQPNFIAADPSGNFLFVGNQSSPVIHSFSLDGSSGTLTSVATYSIPGTPTSIVVSP